jgi:hypothetical protein
MLNLMLTVIGIIFFVLGFLVAFKQKYNLVAFFARAKADNGYAEQVGLILLMAGMLFVLTSIMALVFTSLLFSLVMIAVCLAITSSMFVVSTLRASRV